MQSTATCKHATREAWLQAAAQQMRKWYAEIGLEIPEIRVSLGQGGSKQSLGFCYHKACAADEIPQIYINPLIDPTDLAAPQGILATLCHELIHAALPDGAGHKKTFAKWATEIGLEGKPTHTAAGQGLVLKNAALAEALGDFPHAALVPNKPKQTTRMVKCWCPECGYTCRTTKKWLDAQGTPLCGCTYELREDSPTQMECDA